MTAVEAKLGLAGPGQDFPGLAKAPHQVCIHLLMSSLGVDVFFHKGLGSWQESSSRHQEF